MTVQEFNLINDLFVKNQRVFQKEELVPSFCDLLFENCVIMNLRNGFYSVRCFKASKYEEFLKTVERA